MTNKEKKENGNNKKCKIKEQLIKKFDNNKTVKNKTAKLKKIGIAAKKIVRKLKKGVSKYFYDQKRKVITEKQIQR